MNDPSEPESVENSPQDFSVNPYDVREHDSNATGDPTTESFLPSKDFFVPWNLGFTLLWIFPIAITWVLVELILGIVWIVGLMAILPDSNIEAVAKEVEKSGLFLSVATFVRGGILILVICGIIWLKRCSIKEYLGLNRFSGLQLTISFGLFTGLLISIDLVTFLLGREIIPDFMEGMYQNRFEFLLLVPALVIGAPIFEEILFRGFLYQGMIRTPMKEWFGIFLSSVLFAVIHLQYDWYGVLQVFVIGMALGIARWKTNSLYLVMIMHGWLNLLATIETVVILEFFS